MIPLSLSNTAVAPQPARLLLVEDQPIVVRVMRIALEKLTCFQIDTATTATEAVALAEQNHYDVVLLDIGLPDHDGLWVTEHLRAKAKPPIIIAVSAHMNPTLRERCLEAGMQEALTKPLTVDMIRTVLSDYLSQPK